MQFQITFRHMEATDALKEYAQKRMERFAKYFSDPIACHVTMTTEKYNHRVDVNLQLKNGFKIAGTETTENMYSSLDMVATKIERQVRRYKDKLKGRKIRNLENTPVFHSRLAEIATEPTPEPAPGQEPETEPAPSIAQREQVEVGTMSAADAIMQLNLLHEHFYVFRDEATNAISVVYRHQDGGYGLIETGAEA
jgi:putative sigma-54 modulation protein